MHSKKQSIGRRHGREALGAALKGSAGQRVGGTGTLGLNGQASDTSTAGDYRSPFERLEIPQVLLPARRRKPRQETLDGMQLLTVTDVCKMLRISKPTLWRIRRAGDFPEPTTVTQRVFGWRRLEIEFWLASRQISRRY